MSKMSASIEINAPIDLVFTWIEDPGKVRRRVDGFEETRFHDGSWSAVGSTFVQRIREEDTVLDYNGTIEAFERPTSFVMRLDNSEFRMLVSYQLASIGPALTKVDYSVEMLPTSVLRRVMAVAFSWLNHGLAEGQLSRFKQLAEEEHRRRTRV